MKKRFMAALLGIFSVFALVSCGNGNNSANPSGGGEKTSVSSETDFKSGENMALLNSKSYIFKDQIDFNNAGFIPTYKAKNYDSVPYVNAEDLKSLISAMNDVNVNVKKENNSVTLTK